MIVAFVVHRWSVRAPGAVDRSIVCRLLLPMTGNTG
jgi:hypothetical protein